MLPEVVKPAPAFSALYSQARALSCPSFMYFAHFP